MIALGNYHHKTVTANVDVLLTTSQYFKRFKLIISIWQNMISELSSSNVLYGNFMATEDHLNEAKIVYIYG